MKPMAKHLVVIVSAGRTGTRFFGDTLSEMVTEAQSVHEPDVFEGLTLRTWERLREFGFAHMVLGRLAGTTGIRNLSQKYLAEKIGLDQVAEALGRQRSRYYEGLSAGLILESYYQWYGILPTLPRFAQHYKVAAMIRDPRSWVTSWMNFGAHYGKRDWVSRLGFERLNPAMVGDRQTALRWPELSRMERLCWTWRTVNELILDFVERNENAGLWRYEELFLSERRSDALEAFLAFVTGFSDRSFSYEAKPALLGRRIHASRPDGFPDWRDWSDAQARKLDFFCQPLMQRLGYGDEPEWKAKLAS